MRLWSRWRSRESRRAFGVTLSKGMWDFNRFSVLSYASIQWFDTRRGQHLWAQGSWDFRRFWPSTSFFFWIRWLLAFFQHECLTQTVPCRMRPSLEQVWERWTVRATCGSCESDLWRISRYFKWLALEGIRSIGRKWQLPAGVQHGDGR